MATGEGTAGARLGIVVTAAVILLAGASLSFAAFLPVTLAVVVVVGGSAVLFRRILSPQLLDAMVLVCAF